MIARNTGTARNDTGKFTAEDTSSAHDTSENPASLNTEGDTGGVLQELEVNMGCP